MIRRLKLIALGSCAVVIALACAGGLARATISSFSVDQKAVASPDHTMVTVTGSIECSLGDTFSVFVQVLQAKPGSVANGVINPDIPCTGSVQEYSVDVTVFFPTAASEFKNGPAAVIALADDFSDGSSQDVVTRVVIAGANNVH